MTTSSKDGEITNAIIKKFQTAFLAEPKNRLAQNVVTKYDPLEVCMDHTESQTVSHAYTYKVPEVKPVTNQKASGRCWIFACLNAMRLPFMKQMQLEDFEFSQSYLFLWDKIERINYFLHSYVEVFKKGETPEGRLVSFLLSNPTEDGGQWDMLVNLINKYGVMPKKLFKDVYTSEASSKMNMLLKNKIREFSKKLNEMVQEKKTDEEINAEILGMMQVVHRIVSICLGTPPTSFTWDYYDKNKVYKKIGPITPKDFYEQHVKPFYDVNDKVCIVNDPRPTNTYGKLYTVEYLGNMIGGRKTLYINQPIESMKQMTAASIKAGEAVWFGCDVGKHFHGKSGVLNMDQHNYEVVFDTNVNGLSKSDRLIYGESLMTHAMVFSAVSIDEAATEENNGMKTVKWRVENSWGEERGNKGYLMMTDNWFSEYLYEVVIDKTYVPADVLAIMDQEPVVLPAWDPMGALACSNAEDSTSVACSKL
ncbi:bleomycin hydrolase-like isoform X1 [Anneissia japonica]|uniref:bleomycin hydrolase-like isoform X1 n=1 Tax=Anneissia japonica TaxID=1529436 RepID=UPI001425A965|nr:bleomycin hydrolase-like isoform X1 [Anneissia japonica]